MKINVEKISVHPTNKNMFGILFEGTWYSYYAGDGKNIFLEGHSYDVDVTDVPKGDKVYHNIKMSKVQTPDKVGEHDKPNTSPAQFKEQKSQDFWDEKNKKTADAITLGQALNNCTNYLNDGLDQDDSIEKSMIIARKLYFEYKKLKEELL